MESHSKSAAVFNVMIYLKRNNSLSYPMQQKLTIGQCRQHAFPTVGYATIPYNTVLWPKAVAPSMTNQL
jgi:hypothetical protein